MIRKFFIPHAQQYIVAGILTVIPIWITWVVFEFVFRYLSRFGMPWAQAAAQGIQSNWPNVSSWLVNPWFQSIAASIMTIMALYFLGWFASRVIGKRLMIRFEQVIARIPLVKSVYGAVKKLVEALQQKPENVQRVVLIDFPSPEMKTVGFVTKVLVDEKTGRELAAVYVPTTPNPTSGYLEIVPIEKIISTDWTMDEAMTFIISGGAVAPQHINYFQENGQKTETTTD